MRLMILHTFKQYPHWKISIYIYIYIHVYIQSLRVFCRAKTVPRDPYMGYKIHTPADVNMSLDLFYGLEGALGCSLGSLGKSLGALGVPGDPGAPQGSTRDFRHSQEAFLDAPWALWKYVRKMSTIGREIP